MDFTKRESAKAKGIAVLLLIFHHLFFADRGYTVSSWILSESSLTEIGTAARICVWIFVFVTSYGIAVLYQEKPENESVSYFTFVRWFSLMKGFWFVYCLVFIILLFAGQHPMEKLNGSLVLMLLDFFAVSDFFGTPTLLGAWWYMCFAQMLVFFMPVLIESCKKFGGIVSVMTGFISICFLNHGIVSTSGGDYFMYLMAVIFGILCVQYHFFEKVKIFKNGGGGQIVFWILTLYSVVLLIVARFIVVSDTFPYNNRSIHYIFYSSAAVGICVLTFLLQEKHIESVLLFLGKHSGNMFFTHMFFVHHFGKYIFYTGTVAGTWLTLVVISLIASILIEAVKRLIHYDNWMNADKIVSGYTLKGAKNEG